MKSFATFFGIVYALLGIAGLSDTSIVGTNGLLAADPAYGLVLLLVGSVLLLGVVTGRALEASLFAGAALVIAALSGFLIVSGRGEMFGMLVNTADHWMNLVLGLVLAGTALLERMPRGSERQQHALSTHQRYARYARHA